MRGCLRCRGCISIKCIVSIFFILAALTTTFFFTYIVFPIRRAYWLERSYQNALSRVEMDEFLFSGLDLLEKSERRPRGLIQDVPQLFYWDHPFNHIYSGSLTKYLTYDDLLSLNFDGTGDEPGAEYWIYFGGTAPLTPSDKTHIQNLQQENTQLPIHKLHDVPNPTNRNTSTFTHPYITHSCLDDPSVCTTYNTAFNAIAARWHSTLSPDDYDPFLPLDPGSSTSPSITTPAKLRYVNCDVSPLMCSTLWGIGGDPTMLLHVKQGTQCEAMLQVYRCPTTWSFIGLPIDIAPWTRRVRIPLDRGGSVVVPAFPTAEEQLWAMVSQWGAEDGMVYAGEAEREAGEVVRNVRVEIELPKEKEVDDYGEEEEGEVREWPEYSEFLGIVTWGALRERLDNPFRRPEWPFEYRVRCYVESWLDGWLRWWDGEEAVGVAVRGCGEIDEEAEKEKADQIAVRNVGLRMKRWADGADQDVVRKFLGVGEDVDLCDLVDGGMYDVDDEEFFDDEYSFAFANATRPSWRVRDTDYP
ncbi:hypothetical protein BU24DRAFT_411651 [Aaosphaeria arxii CBS 175.79]|uniref:Uncharacterized protein n=1 Tax=Aaosphaeria arxii CBS 175.79 TaxID=1450172 RepID=A0A6A5XMJ0_9PLEO|nr:uncharacterized protein BU24DRAFT_411651 [Aaosphaeria arxii CBS 175.79]KAF2013960.1 hypothetical protein BU24DRAFT_411651 [Aaosphaeria arxii CBS 175.79]